VTPAWRQLTLLSLAEFLALSLWFSASAVLPALQHDWGLGDGGSAGLTIAVQAGFIVGTLISALTNLPDVFSARMVMKVGITLGALTNAALALWVSSLGPALEVREKDGETEYEDWIYGEPPHDVDLSALWEMRWCVSRL